MAGSSVLARLAVLISGDTAGLNKSLNTSTKALGTFQKGASAVSASLAGIAAGVSFVALGKEIINVTAEFQKFEAVLTNTLGSNSEAQKALEQIREFAAKTPFSVQELTSSFVKLANQGFEPTRDEMRKLGDLASSTGKSFDQLTEAIIDAQTGEFERLKEFGIRATKSGDQVKFTFKGVETQTKFTSASIREYLLRLGDLEGVSGSMAAISETLGGKISNLADAFDNLLLNVGNAASGPGADFIDFLTGAIKSAEDALTDDKIFTRLGTINELFVESANNVEKITEKLDRLTRLQKIEQKAYDDATAKLGDLNTQLSLSSDEYFKLVQEQRTAKDFANSYGSAIEALTIKMERLNKETTTQAVALIPDLQAKIKNFEKLKNEAFDTESIGRFNVKIQELRDQLDVLNQTGFESGFLKALNEAQAQGQTIQIEEPTLGTPSSANPFATALPTPDFATILTGYEEVRNAQQTTYEELFDLLKKEEAARLAAAESARDWGIAVGSALGEAISGEKDFANVLKSITQKVLDLFLKQALGAIVAAAAKAGGPPPVAIALAALGMAAISAMFASIGKSSGGGRGGSIGGRATENVTRIGRADRPEDRIEGNVTFEIEGNKLKGVLNNNDKRTQRTG
jgi:hypothetical protein